MTDHHTGDPTDGEVTTDEAFEAALGRLLLLATQNGIDPLGSWVYRSDQTTTDLEVVVYELEGDE
jgi:hypothetical protein